MSSTFIINIKLLAGIHENVAMLAGKSMAEMPCLSDAYLVVEGDRIADFGKMEDLIASGFMAEKENIIDAKDRSILPCWCDSHTHIVYAGSREDEFVSKIRGKTYSEINAEGGGILNSSAKLNAASEDELFTDAWKRVEAVARLGTGALEIKSGYGLTVEGELKMLRVIRKIKEKSKLNIKSSFLGAHTYPVAYKDDHKGYISMITDQLLPVIAKEKLADYIDVFCEESFFTPGEAETICRSGMKFGLIPKLHVNQLHSIGGIELGIGLNVLSMDHLEVLSDQEIRMIADAQDGGKKGPMATLLPSAAFFLNMPLQPGRKLIDAGCAVALATDYNPGSSPSGNMNFVIALSCIQMRLLPTEAINAATVNGAFAMDCQQELGSITRGKMASLIITKPIPSLAFLPYSFGTNLIDQVMIKGELIR